MVEKDFCLFDQNINFLGLPWQVHYLTISTERSYGFDPSPLFLSTLDLGSDSRLCEIERREKTASMKFARKSDTVCFSQDASLSPQSLPITCLVE